MPALSMVLSMCWDWHRHRRAVILVEDCNIVRPSPVLPAIRRGDFCGWISWARRLRLKSSRIPTGVKFQSSNSLARSGTNAPHDIGCVQNDLGPVRALSPEPMMAQAILLLDHLDAAMPRCCHRRIRDVYTGSVPRGPKGTE